MLYGRYTCKPHSLADFCLIKAKCCPFIVWADIRLKCLKFLFERFDKHLLNTHSHTHNSFLFVKRLNCRNKCESFFGVTNLLYFWHLHFALTVFFFFNCFAKTVKLLKGKMLNENFLSRWFGYFNRGKREKTTVFMSIRLFSIVICFRFSISFTRPLFQIFAPASWCFTLKINLNNTAHHFIYFHFTQNNFFFFPNKQLQRFTVFDAKKCDQIAYTVNLHRRNAEHLFNK